MGSPAGHGWVWYESTGEGFSDWSMIERLPYGTVVGLKHSLIQDDKYFVWDGVKYDPADPDIAPPRWFVRKHIGDLCAPKGEGFFFYEKVTPMKMD